MKTVKYVFEDVYCGYCQKCEVIIAADRDELNTNQVPCAGRFYNYVTCPSCKTFCIVEPSRERYEPYRINTLYLLYKFMNCDIRLTQMEYSPPNGSEFKKILREAEENGDFS